MNIKSLKTQFIGAIAMVLVAAVAMGSSTYAWFAMNNKVDATGMEVRTSTGDNLLIAAGETGNTAKPDDSAFKTAYVAALANTVLEPISSIDGVTYYYNSTKNVTGNGDAASDNYIAYDAADRSAFNNNYGQSTAFGYVDYAFFLKASNADTVAKDVKVTKLNLTYGGSTQTQKAFRVAVFVNDMGENGSTPATAPEAGTLLSIIKVSDASYFTSTNAINSTTTLAAVSKLNNALTIGNVPAQKTNYYKVVVRLWLEGEDTTCNNDTFATLNDKWALDVDVELGGANAVISALNQAVTASKEDLSSASAAGDPTVISGVSYYPITSHAGFYATATGAIASDSRIYKIVGNLPYDVTNECTLPAATP